MSSVTKAFTLAEVLITLLVIGIIASIVISNIQKFNDDSLKVAFKKTYAEIALATRKMSFDNGGSLKGLFTSNNVFKNKYAEYLNYSVSCNNGSSLGVCWHLNDGSSKGLNNQPVYSWTNYAGMILSNGSLLWIGAYSSTCTSSYTGSDIDDCGWIVVDVNGFKKPNSLGKDIFYIHVLENSVQPFGLPADNISVTNSCSNGNLGISCAIYVLKDEGY